MKTGKRGIYNIIFALLGQLVVVGIGLILPRLLVKNFGSETNGLIMSVTQVLAYFSVFEAGLSVVAVRTLYKPISENNINEIKDILASTRLFYNRTGIIYAAAVIIVAFVYPFFIDTELSYFFIVAVFLCSGFGNCAYYFIFGKIKVYMQAEGVKYAISNITTIIHTLINVVKMVLLLLGFDALAVQFSYLIIMFIEAGIYMIYAKRRYKWMKPEIKVPKTKLKQTSAAVVHQVSTVIFNSTDMLLLTILTRDLKIVSIYSMYNYVITSASGLMQQLVGSFDYRLGQLFHTDKTKFYGFHHVFEIAYMAMSFSVMTAIYVVMLPFMRLYTATFTDVNYISAIYPLFFVITPMFSIGRMSANNLINIAGHFKQTMWRSILESAINLTVSVICVFKFGLIGALLGTIVASIYRTIDMELYVYKYLLPGKPLKSFKRWILCILIFAAVVVFVPSDVSFLNTYPKVILGGAVALICAAIIYCGTLLATNPEERKIIFSTLSSKRSHIKKKLHQ